MNVSPEIENSQLGLLVAAYFAAFATLVTVFTLMWQAVH